MFFETINNAINGLLVNEVHVTIFLNLFLTSIFIEFQANQIGITNVEWEPSAADYGKPIGPG